PGTYTLGGMSIRLVEHWSNTREEFEITNDNASAFRAVEVSLRGESGSGTWIGEDTGSGPGVIEGLTVEVLAPGNAWDAPAPATREKGYFFGGETKTALGAVGSEAAPGWTIQGIKHFDRAMATTDGLTNSTDGPANPAVEVLITDGKGSVERHTAFADFPDMVMSKKLEGSARSGLTLSPARSSRAGGEALTLFGDVGVLQAGYVSPGGEVSTFKQEGALPWTIHCGSRSVTILKDYPRAQERSRFVKAPPSAEFRPAWLVSIDGAEPTPLAWKGILPASASAGGATLLRHGPRTVTLPFSLRLSRFHKSDYPGTDMAMAYESDVAYAVGGQQERSTTISMNNPLVSSGWKVYQSGFVGQDVSIFSVMRDPGLVLTYISCATLCIGILITFYGRGLSWGHPGIPTPFSTKENGHVPQPVGDTPVPVLRPVAGGPEPVGPGLEADAGVAGDPGRRAGDAAGYVCA
ncbi:MAG: cytochrome c biogenesis protein ResB, partial [Phycisphaerales bacterium]